METDERKETIYRITYDVKQSLRDLRSLETRLSKIEQLRDKLSTGKPIAFGIIGRDAERSILAQQAALAALEKTTSRVLGQQTRLEKARQFSAAKGSERVQRAIREEKEARDRLTAAMGRYEKGAKKAGREVTRAGKSIERIMKADERATRRAANEMDRAVRKAIRARDQFKKTFLNIGRDSRGLGAVVRNATTAALALVSLHRVLQKIGEAKDRYMRFDELTTATLTITNAGEKAFEYGSKGAERYRDAIREAANEVKTSAAEMADSALFWAKAGQTNADTITELAKIGTIFARANRDAANNVLDQARANDILSDALQLFRKDTSTTEKAVAEATSLGDKLTAAANSSNIVVEQLFDYSRKVAGLFKTGEVADEEIMAIAASLASAGLKEESGVHVRRILTQLAQGSVQKLLKGVGIDVADKEGNIRSFGDIFGELQKTLKTQKPLERMSFLKELFGQRAVSTAAALAGLNEEGLPGETSVQAILEKIDKAGGIMKRNQMQYLETVSGRVKDLTSTWSNAFDKMLEKSGIMERMLAGLQDIDPTDFFEWMDRTAVPALESFGDTVRNTVIPGVQMAGENLSEWFSPALSVASSLLGSTTSSAEGLSDTITTLVKIWVKWRLALLAIRGLRMVDWLTSFAKQAAAAAAASRTLGTATTSSVTAATTAVGKLPGAFTAAGVGIAAAIAAWGLYDLLVGPIDDAKRRLEELHAQYGKKFELLNPGDENIESLTGRISDARKALLDAETKRNAGPIMSVETQAERDLRADLERLKSIRSAQVREKYGLDKDRTVVLPGQSKLDNTWSGRPRQSLPMQILEDRFKSAKITGTDTELENAKDDLIRGLEDHAAQQQQVVNEQSRKLAELAHEMDNSSDQRANEINKNMVALANQLKSNENQLRATDARMKELANEGKKERLDETVKRVEAERKEIRRRSFQGGRSRPLDPFATPLLTGLDKDGNRIINLAVHHKGAGEFLNMHPGERDRLVSNVTRYGSVINVNFGDNSYSITTPRDASPDTVARILNDEIRKIGDQENIRRQRDLERALGSIAPSDM